MKFLRKNDFGHQICIIETGSIFTISYCNGTNFDFRRCHVQDRKLAALSSLVRAPFSVLFDAVRCEDWLGQDSFLPFTKVKKNLRRSLINLIQTNLCFVGRLLN
jgi:hypothetical protein